MKKQFTVRISIQ